MGTIWPTSLSDAPGAVEGRLQAVSTDGLCLLVLEDRLSGRPVVGYLAAGTCAAARAHVGLDVVVHGRVQRETATGIAVAIREVSQVIPLQPADADPLAFRKFRGILPRREGDLPPEERIRRLRDGIR